MTSRSLRLRRQTAWLNPIVKFVLAALICVGLPFVLLGTTYEFGLGDYVLQNTAWACLAGLTVGFWMGFKWVSDWLLSLVLVPLLTPVMVLAAIAIKLDSRGPVFFRQIRVGYRGEHFRVFKFRTMQDSNGHHGANGIAGWAQINQGHVADLADIKKKLEYDF